MQRIKRLWMPVLAGVVLVATVAGVASAKPNSRPQQQAWRVLTVPHSACTGGTQADQFTRQHNKLWCNATCWLVCNFHFPAAGEQAVGAVNVKRVTMYAWDNYPVQDLEFWLNKVHPPSLGNVTMAYAKAANVATDPQVVMDTSIEYNPIYRVQGPYIYIFVGGPAPVVYGFFIHYTWM